MGASFGLPNEKEYFNLMPSAYFKNIAMGAINYALGGVVSGIYRPEIVNSKWTGSNQVTYFTSLEEPGCPPSPHTFFLSPWACRVHFWSQSMPDVCSR